MFLLFNLGQVDQLERETLVFLLGLNNKLYAVFLIAYCRYHCVIHHSSSRLTWNFRRRGRYSINSRVSSAPENGRDAALPLRKSREGEESTLALIRARHLWILSNLKIWSGMKRVRFSIGTCDVGHLLRKGMNNRPALQSSCNIYLLDYNISLSNLVGSPFVKNLHCEKRLKSLSQPIEAFRQPW